MSNENVYPVEPEGLQSPSIANPIRTATQLVPGVVITEFIDAFIHDLSEKQYAALIGILLLATSYAQNLWEQRKGIKFLGAKYQLPK